MAAADTKGSVASLKLHPLVIINISDHYTRMVAQEGRDVEVFGALFGTQKGREVEIFNSFEILVEKGGDGYRVDRDFVQQKTALFKEVFKTLDFLGWYTNSSGLLQAHYDIQQQMTTFAELPLLLLLNTQPSRATPELPVTVFEAFVDEIIGEKQRMHFVPVPYEIASEEAERVGVEHVAQMLSTAGSTTSEATAHLRGQFNAISMLHSRIVQLRAYIAAVAQGSVAPNHVALRALRGLLSRLPVVESSSFAEDTMRATNDVLLMSYLATLTKGCNAMNEMMDHASILRRSRF